MTVRIGTGVGIEVVLTDDDRIGVQPLNQSQDLVVLGDVEHALVVVDVILTEVRNIRRREFEREPEEVIPHG